METTQDQLGVPGSAALAEPRPPHADDAASREYTLSIDTGGTFTDGFVTDGERSAQVKVDTTPHDLTIGFQACVEAAAVAVGESVPGFLASLGAFHFSSTIATNTIVERRGARVGLLVSAGAERDLYGADGQVEALSAFLDPELVRGVPEEVDDRGVVVSEPMDADVEAAVRELLERGIRLLVVSFSNAHLNPANELRARAIIDRSYPRHYLGAVPLMIASRISLAAGDHGRTATAVINAYLHPNLVRSLYRAEDQTRDAGLKRPLLIVNTDGSSSRVAKTRAIDTYNSGPSAGVLGAGYVAELLGAHQVCTFDVGGTTTDVAYLPDGAVLQHDATDVGPAVIPHPSIALASFGLGGGSVITARADGTIGVGPESAGSAPGPASFGLGGTSLTPTDVWLLLGYLQPGEFLGGRRTLDPGRAEAAASELAERLGVDVQQATLTARAAIADELGRQLTEWAQQHPRLAESPPSERWLFSYGGGGGLLCVDAATALGIPRVVVFPHSSVFSAFGGGLLPIAHSYEAVVPVGSPRETVTTTVARLADNARRDLRAEGIRRLGDVTATLSVADAPAHSTSLEELIARPRAPIEIDEPLSRPVRCRLGVSVARDVRLSMLAADAASEERRREIITSDGTMSVPVLPGLGLGDADPEHGPAFLEAPDTTIFVPAGWSVRFTDEGYGVLSNERRAP